MSGLAAGGEMLFLIERKHIGMQVHEFFTGAGWTFDAMQAARYVHETAAYSVAQGLRAGGLAAEVHAHIFG